MAVTEQARHQLYTYFAETMGDERAATLMELLPPTGWGDVATKQDLALMRVDLEHVRVDLRKEIEHVRVDLRKEIEHVRVDLRKEIEGVGVELRQEFEHLRATTRKDIAHLTELTQKEFASVRTELRGTLERALRVHTLATVTVFMAMPAAMAAWTQLL